MAESQINMTPECLVCWRIFGKPGNVIEDLQVLITELKLLRALQMMYKAVHYTRIYVFRSLYPRRRSCKTVDS